MIAPLLFASALLVQTPLNVSPYPPGSGYDLVLDAYTEYLLALGACEHVLPEEIRKNIADQTNDPAVDEYTKSVLEAGRNSPAARDNTFDTCKADLLNKDAKLQALKAQHLHANP